MRISLKLHVGLWACEGVKSAEALPTSTPKEIPPKPAAEFELAPAASDVEVGTENADFNVFFVAAETETRRCEDGLNLASLDSQRSPSLTGTEPSYSSPDYEQKPHTKHSKTLPNKPLKPTVNLPN